MKSKKELKEAYIQMKIPAGMYRIRNLMSGMSYLDVNNNLDAIWNRHRTQLKFGTHRNSVLQQDWDTYGESNFVFEILEEIDTEDLTAEQISTELKILLSLYLDESDKDQFYNK